MSTPTRVTEYRAPHTPGPWRVGDFPFDVITDEPDTYHRVATIASDQQGLNRGREESEANVRLIAAAPELLEACRLFTDAAHEVRDILNGDGYACPASIALAAEKARNAIAKVQGDHDARSTDARRI